MFKWWKKYKENKRWERIKKLEIDLAMARAECKQIRRISECKGNIYRSDEVRLHDLSGAIAKKEKEIELLRFESVMYQK